MTRLLGIVIWFFMGLVLLAYPHVISGFHAYLLIEIMIFSIFGVSFYLLLGHTGLLSFGHAAYFGLSAYVTALFLIHLPDYHILLAMLAGSLSALLGGLVIGSFLLRLSKIYFALGTLAFSQLIWAMAWKWRDVTGGDDGLIGWSTRLFALPLIGHFTISNLHFLYYFVLAVTLFSILLCWLFLQTPLGNSLASLKSNPDRAQFLGINAYLAKFFLFGFSALIAGLSGSLYALFQKIVSPKVLDMFTSFDVVVISVLGGYTSFSGPIIGSFIYTYMGEYLSGLTERWQLIMGAVFILIVLFYPHGLAQALKNIIRRITEKVRNQNG